MEELIRRNPRRNSTPVPNDITQVWNVTYTTCKDLPLRGTETVKPHPHHGASRPANPLVTLEDRTQEIFYQDIHALLPPPPSPPLPSGSGPAKTDNFRGLYGRGKPAERQQSRPTNPPPSPSPATPQTALNDPHTIPLPQGEQVTIPLKNPSKHGTTSPKIISTGSVAYRNPAPPPLQHIIISDTCPLNDGKRSQPKILGADESRDAAKLHDPPNTKKTEGGQILTKRTTTTQMVPPKIHRYNNDGYSPGKSIWTPRNASSPTPQIRSRRRYSSPGI